MKVSYMDVIENEVQVVGDGGFILKEIEVVVGESVVEVEVFEESGVPSAEVVVGVDECFVD